MAEAAHIPPLYGLVLSGGKSSRMGRDKGTIAYHGKPQREYLYELLQGICERTFLSIRSDQEQSLDNNLAYIADRDIYKGPFNGLLSAHATYPDAAWLVLACDLPFIDRATLDILVDARNSRKDATALATSASGLPEPLAAIWEPHGLTKAITYLPQANSSCPRKFLLQSETTLVLPEDDHVLYNANSVEDFHEVRAKLTAP